MTAVLSTGLLMYVLVSLSDLPGAQLGQGSGLRGTWTDVYDAAEDFASKLRGPFHSRK